MRVMVCAVLLATTAACSGGADEAATANQTVSLRNLTDQVAGRPRARYQIEGREIPTPSDPQGDYYLLRHTRPAFRETVVGVLREEKNGRVAYARVEVDCGKRLFHVLGVGNRRSFAETHIAYDGPLRPITGLPLRVELATFICRTAGTPLASA